MFQIAEYLGTIKEFQQTGTFRQYIQYNIYCLKQYKDNLFS